MTSPDTARAADRRGVAPKPWKIYDVTVTGYGTSPITAPSRGRALAQAWGSDAFNTISFGDFIKIASARVRTDPPSPDGYDYVRRAYGVDLRVDQEIELRNEGERWNGRRGIVLYPGGSTASVHVQFDGIDRPIIVHPDNVVAAIPSAASPGAADDGGRRG